MLTTSGPGATAPKPPAGTPELNCCSVNGPRSLGMLAEWVLMRAPDGFALNYYGPSVLGAALSAGNWVSLILSSAAFCIAYVLVGFQIDIFGQTERNMVLALLKRK